MPEDPAYVILDANLLLHFKRPDEVDWLAYTHANGVVLLASPILFRELEQEKIFNQLPKLRERAVEAIKWLSDLDSTTPVKIRPGVTLEFIRHSPTLDFSAHRLYPRLPDDQLIACALEYSKEHNRVCVIATNDSGLRLKLPAHGLKALQMRGEDKLPDALDDQAKEIKRLRDQIARYQSRLPKLVLTFSDGQGYHSYEIPKGPQTGSTIKDLNKSLTSGRPETWEEYEQQDEDWQREMLLYFPCQLSLLNAGSGISTHTIVELQFPAFVSPVDCLPAEPEEPGWGFEITRSLYSAMNLRFGPTRANIDAAANTVRFDIGELVQGRSLALDEFYFRFQDHKAIKSFSVPSAIFSAEVSEPITGDLHFIFSKQSDRS
jgi:hypothetical protein